MIKRKVLVVVAFFMLAVVSAFFIIQANGTDLILASTLRLLCKAEFPQSTMYVHTYFVNV